MSLSIISCCQYVQFPYFAHFSLFILHFPHFSFFIIHLLDPIEKSLLKQRLINLPAAQNGYIEKQKKALAN